MAHLHTIRLFTHGLDQAQTVLLERAKQIFHAAQQLIVLEEAGERHLEVKKDGVDFDDLHPVCEDSEVSELTVIGQRMVDNWFVHARSGLAMMTLHDWEVAFWESDEPDGDELHGAAPDASVLMSLALTSFYLIARADEKHFLHREVRGCISDFCDYKPQRAIKMRSGYICRDCVAESARRGVSPTALDAIRSILEEVRGLTLGRTASVRQVGESYRDGDDAFLRNAPSPDISIPPGLVDAARRGQLAVVVGSGMSLQADVEVAYPGELGWSRLPSWVEVLPRLSDSLLRYRDKKVEPRNTAELDALLVELDYFRAELKDGIYYPRAVFDIFVPDLSNPGLANRLLFRLPLRYLLTTNYDLVLNAAAPQGTMCFTWKEARQAREFCDLAAGRPKHPVLVKIHGCASRADTIVLTGSEYLALSQSEGYKAFRSHIFDVPTILFLGYGLNDPFDLDLAFRHAEAAGAAQGEKFVLIHEEKVDEVNARHPNAQLLRYANHSDVAPFLAELWRRSQ